MKSILSLLLVGTIATTTIHTYSANAYMGFQEAKETEAVTVELGKRYLLQSGILEEEREILVHLPKSYDPSDGNTQKYPVIVVLDGDSHFGHATLGSGLLEENSRMPEAIIVAIPNGRGTRGRDMAREMDKFRNFIGNEVLPFVEAKFPTSGHKTLFGHSLAGYFTLSVLADDGDMFDAYVAASPVVQVRNSELLGKFEKIFSEKAGLTKSLYFTLADEAEEGVRATSALNNMVALFKEKAPENFDWRYDFIDNQVHMTTPFLTVYQGLSHSFADYQAPRYVTKEEFEKAGGMAGLQAFFERRAGKYNTPDTIPSEVMQNTGFLYSSAGDHEGAIKLLAANLDNHKEDLFAYHALGRAYGAAELFEDAVKTYEMAVVLAEKQESSDLGFLKRQVERYKKSLSQ
ncbi:hypothetical protein KFE96_07995 [Kordiimonas sp. SCSIO 12603]|uniref:alpha/beta hydrolase-fold protein n=1 Tax=Kordiimonas sp. SCSIO 12603 TaxID=2829596 RepID=UPI002102CB57|nr:alpha/beta hydrolase-fold protein [Kordiimonas sp. SCSIO 12603]UTW60243.1 hypothetical protein KFE96_07995 [Kordiimonas sp. SCSIO 12603]